jgi:hypothetical protein
MQVNLDLHPQLHQVFNFAENTESMGCCCFWRSRPVNYIVNKKNILVPSPKNETCFDRMMSEIKLQDMIKNQFDKKDRNEGLQLVKNRIRDPLCLGEPITEQRLNKIVQAIYAIKLEIY